MVDALGLSFDEALEQVVPEARRDAVRALREAELPVPIVRARVVSGRGGPRAWFQDWDPSQGYYWRRLRGYLLDHVGRSESDLESLDDSSDIVLSHLEDP